GSGFNRVSMGMQSAVPHVLATLDRTHDPDKIPEVDRWVKEAGLDLSLDLIYGTPGESIEDWRRSLDVALSNDVDHISAYSLIVEPGTKMGAMVRRGQLPMPDEDDLADKYEIADAAMTAAGLHWYEVSNWSTGPETRCLHNMAYWQGADWWGYGPGAHSHVGGVRFWNAKHPRAWADRLLAGQSPSIGREVLDEQTREIERIMLAARIDSELRLDSLAAGSEQAIRTFVKQGLLDEDGVADGRFKPALQGRLLADHTLRVLTEFVCSPPPGIGPRAGARTAFRQPAGGVSAGGSLDPVRGHRDSVALPAVGGESGDDLDDDHIDADDWYQEQEEQADADDREHPADEAETDF